VLFLLSLSSSSSSSSSCDALRRESGLKMATVRVLGMEGRRDWMEAVAAG